MTSEVPNETLRTQPELEAYSLLRQINSMLEMFNRYDLRGEGLTVPQFAILSYATPEGVPLSTISSQMMCDNSNLTGIVDRLISKGLVERRPDPQDRRVSLICLTEDGADTLRRLRPRHHASVQKRMRKLSNSEMEQLRNLLQTLHEGLEDVLHDEEEYQQVARSVSSSARRNTAARNANAGKAKGRIRAIYRNDDPTHRHDDPTAGPRLMDPGTSTGASSTAAE